MPATPERDVWVFHIPVGHKLHAKMLRGIVLALGVAGPILRPALEKYWLPMPLSSRTILEAPNMETAREIERELTSCAWAVLKECDIKAPDLFDEKVKVPGRDVPDDGGSWLKQAAPSSKPTFGPSNQST